MSDNNGNVQLVDAEELGKILGLPRESVWTLAREKAIPSFRIRHLYRFDPKRVLEAIEDNGNES